VEVAADQGDSIEALMLLTKAASRVLEDKRTKVLRFPACARALQVLQDGMTPQVTWDTKDP
jgi:hypothetical protein